MTFLNVHLYYRVGRDEALMEAVPLVRETLLDGKTVLVHCNKSFHRGPALGAALLKVLEAAPNEEAEGEEGGEEHAEAHAEAAPPEQADSSTARASMTAKQHAEERARRR